MTNSSQQVKSKGRILTNKYGLPEPILRAMLVDTYIKRGDISVTTLIDSPKINILRNKFEYYEDISDMVWALRGTAVHSVLERSAEQLDLFDEANGLQKRYTSEFQMEYEVKINENDPDEKPIILTGTTDLIYNLEPVTLFDYKDTSVWKVKDCTKSVDTETGQVIYQARGKACLDWQKQTNIYAFILKRKYNILVRKIRIIVLLKDWKKQDSLINNDYPEKPIAIVDIPIYKEEVIENFIKERIKIHKLHYEIYRKNGIDAVPECTPEERWKKNDTWKMMSSPTASRSSKNFEITSKTDEMNAQIYFDTEFSIKNPTGYINKVQGFEGRCMDYCPMNIHCHFYKSIITKK